MRLAGGLLVALGWVVAVIAVSARVMLGRLARGGGDFLTNVPIPAWWWVLVIGPPVLFLTWWIRQGSPPAG